MVTETKKTTPAKAAPAQATAPDLATAPAEATALTDDPAGGLSIGDLKNLATIMDVASTRGAFRANEMATVGLLYNKLNTFLSKVAPARTDQGLASNPTQGLASNPIPTPAPATAPATTNK